MVRFEPSSDHAPTPTSVVVSIASSRSIPRLTLSSPAGRNRLSYARVKANSAQLLRWFRTFAVVRSPSVASRESPWAREVAALRAVVLEMRDELRGAQVRERVARHMAFHDDLTALPNRRYFRERLDLALQRTNKDTLQLSVMYVDLDGFKALNDTHGHEIGDQFLKAVAHRLANSVRAEDIVSRLGGDEYACLVTGVAHRERLQLIASALYRAVSSPFKMGAVVLTVRPSIGIAVYPDDGTTTDSLLQAADAAMYAAKRTRSGTSFSEKSAGTPLHLVTNAAVVINP